METDFLGCIGVITTRDDGRIFEVTGTKNGLLFCLSIDAPRIVAACMPGSFWILLDRMP